MKKFFSILLIALSILTLATPSVFAEEINVTRIKLDDVYVNVPYNEEDILVEYENNGIEVIATIKDKYTGEILGVHGEYIATLENLPKNVLIQLPASMQMKAERLRNERNNKGIALLSGQYYYNKVVYNDKNVYTGHPVTGSTLEAKVRLYCDFEYYSYGKDKIITSVISHNWAVMQGNYNLESEVSNAIIQSNKTSIKVYGRTNIKREIVVTLSESNEYSGHLDATIKRLVEAGFSASTTSTTSTTETIMVRYTINNFEYFYSIV